MMKNNGTPHNLIKIWFLIIFVLCSCANTKSKITNDKNIKLCLDDFFKTYNNLLPLSKINAVYILERKSDEGQIIKIMDCPIEVIFGTLNQNDYNLKIGNYNNILCQFNLVDNNQRLYFLEDMISSILEKAKSEKKITFMSGKTYSLTYGALEWEPKIEIDYNITLGTKTIRDLTTGMEFKEKW